MRYDSIAKEIVPVEHPEGKWLLRQELVQDIQGKGEDILRVLLDEPCRRCEGGCSCA